MNNPNDDELERFFQERFTDFTAEPPTGALWQILNKVNDFEDTPHDELEIHFKKRFVNYEAEPPANALPEILAEVNQPAPAIRWFSYRYAAALALLLLSFIGVAWYINKTDSRPELAANNDVFKQKIGRKTNQPQSSENQLVNPENQPSIEKTLPGTSANIASKSAQNLVFDLKTTALAKQKTPPPLEDTFNNTTEVKSIPFIATKLANQPTITMKEPLVELKQSKVFSEELETMTAVNEKNQEAEIPKNLTSRKPVSQPNESISAEKAALLLPEKQIVSNATTPNTTETTIISNPSLSNEAVTPLPVTVAFATSKGLKKSLLSFATPLVQDIESDQSWYKKPSLVKDWDMYTSFMPLYNYYTISPNQQDNEVVENIRPAAKFSNQRSGWRFQMGGEFSISKRFKMRAGFSYLQMNHYVSYLTRSAVPEAFEAKQINNQTIEVTPVYKQYSRLSDTQWHYAGLRSDVLFKLNGKGVMAHYLSGGVEGVMQLDQGGSPNVYINLAYGISYPLSQGISLRVEPTFNYGLKSRMDDNNYLSLHPYSAGLNFGLVWQAK